MLYELRVYEIAPGRMPAIVNRFANITLEFFKKHGVKPVLFLEPVLGVSNQLTYLLQWESLAERESCWDAFQSDPGWIAARAETEKDGAIVLRFTNTLLRESPSIMAKVKEMQS
ncbi:MAG: NIPSNAP family protein [Chloroflexota bacterium]